MKKNEIVKNNIKFNDIINKGKYVKNQHYIIYIMKKETIKPNFGIAVGNKIGKAYVRNKYKRRIRCILDEHKNLFQNYNDYIIIMKKACTELTYAEMNNSLKSLIEKVK